jgi:hypothetical protein
MKQMRLNILHSHNYLQKKNTGSELRVELLPNHHRGIIMLTAEKVNLTLLENFKAGK